MPSEAKLARWLRGMRTAKRAFDKPGNLSMRDTKNAKTITAAMIKVRPYVRIVLS